MVAQSGDILEWFLFVRYCAELQDSLTSPGPPEKEARLIAQMVISENFIVKLVKRQEI